MKRQSAPFPRPRQSLAALTELANAQPSTVIIKLFEIAVRVRCPTKAGSGGVACRPQSQL
jgi:hypothetical protein